MPVQNEKLISNSLSSARVGIFAREAHASYLLGKVVNLRLDPEYSLYEAEQLNSTLQALSVVIHQDIETSEGEFYAAAMGICDRLPLSSPFYHQHY
jgi:hypothetical protein